MKTYNKLNDYYLSKFGQRTLKICIDGGFTCPNRDGTKGTGGCIFCGALGAGDNIDSSKSIQDQVKSFLDSYKGDRASSFIAYFQSYTNTYGSIETLKKKYDEALCDERIVGLDIDTRPDCITEEVCQLLASYKDRYYVMCELGLQTGSNKTHSLLNQCNSNEDFIRASNLLNKYEIDIVVHLMVGLPYETHKDIVNSVNFLNDINYQGLKIHSTYIMKNTKLEKMYFEKEYEPLSYDDYIDEVLYILKHIREDVIIHRISGDPPKDQCVAPLWCLHKHRVLNDIDNIMLKNHYYQGMSYKK